MSDLYRLIYTSRNFLRGGEAEQSAEVEAILAVSKRNNARVGVTGALLFNAGFFAQILEGPRAAVEATFERIQRDPRHSDVSVLQCEPVAARGFPNWSMAFVGHAARGRTLWGDFAEQTNFDLRHMEADRLFATLLTIVEREENEASLAHPFDASPVSPHAAQHAPPHAAHRDPRDPPSAAPRGPGLDVERLRGALRDQLRDDLRDDLRNPASAPRAAVLAVAPQVAPPSPGPAQAGEAGVLRAALDEERARTTALRRELDDARVALAAARAEIAAAGRLGEIWAERARAMAAILAREPEAGRAEGAQSGAARPTLVKSAG